MADAAEPDDVQPQAPTPDPDPNPAPAPAPAPTQDPDPAPAKKAAGLDAAGAETAVLAPGIPDPASWTRTQVLGLPFSLAARHQDAALAVLAINALSSALVLLGLRALPTWSPPALLDLYPLLMLPASWAVAWAVGRGLTPADSTRPWREDLAARLPALAAGIAWPCVGLTALTVAGLATEQLGAPASSLSVAAGLGAVYLGIGRLLPRLLHLLSAPLDDLGPESLRELDARAPSLPRAMAWMLGLYLIGALCLVLGYLVASPLGSPRLGDAAFRVTSRALGAGFWGCAAAWTIALATCQVVRWRHGPEQNVSARRLWSLALAFLFVIGHGLGQIAPDDPDETVAWQCTRRLERRSDNSGVDSDRPIRLGEYVGSGCRTVGRWAVFGAPGKLRCVVHEAEADHSLSRLIQASMGTREEPLPEGPRVDRLVARARHLEARSASPLRALAVTLALPPGIAGLIVTMRSNPGYGL